MSTSWFSRPMTTWSAEGAGGAISQSEIRRHHKHGTYNVVSCIGLETARKLQLVNNKAPDLTRVDEHSYPLEASLGLSLH